MKNCISCEKDFKPSSNRQLYCKPSCRKKYITDIDKKNLSKYFEEEYLDKNYKKVKKYLKNSYYKAKEFLIPYDSPTGSAYIGLAKEPLIENKGGFGYKGVLLQTDNRQFVQCHICGKWMKSITAKHLAKHDTNHEKYTETFSLNKSNKLVSDATSYKLEKNARKRKGTTYLIANLASISQEASKKGVKKWKERKHSEEYHNQFGTCQKQLGYRLLEYVRKYKDLPSRSIKGEGGKLSKALYRRYGSLNNGFKAYGFPARHRIGTNVELISLDKERISFNYNKPYDKDQIGKWILFKHDISQFNKMTN